MLFFFLSNSLYSKKQTKLNFFWTWKRLSFHFNLISFLGIKTKLVCRSETSKKNWNRNVLNIKFRFHFHFHGQSCTFGIGRSEKHCVACECCTSKTFALLGSDVIKQLHKSFYFSTCAWFPKMSQVKYFLIFRVNKLALDVHESFQ